jgi:CHAD domain-containing protein
LSELRRFVVEDGSDMTRLVSGLAERASFARDPDRLVERTVYDTFDWRLHAERTVLEHEREVPVPPARGGHLPKVAPPALLWRSSETAEVLGRIGADHVPRFTADLPAGPIADRLSDIVEMRALLPLVTIRDEQVALRLLDDEGKTQARVLIHQASLVDAGPGAAQATAGEIDPVVGLRLDPTVEVLPVRGYPRAADQVADLLAAQVVLRPVGRDIVTEALVAVGLQPGDYSSKLKLRLDATATALDVVTTVLATLLETMRANEPGTRADIDSEFLHDFRVAIRRSRSVLGFAKGVVAPDLLDHLRAEFKWLGDITTPTRDLDVYLLTYVDFEASLPEPIRPDLRPLLSFLVERQRAEHAELVAALDSPRHQQLLVTYEAWLADPSTDPRPDQPAHRSVTGPDAELPATRFAAARIWKAYRSLVKDGRRITDDTPPPVVHELRKDAKKLRYALECFGSLFPADEIVPLIKELKGVQDVLGDFQDAEVQKDSLRHFGEALVVERGPGAAPTLMAMGYLIEQLDEREQDARDGFAHRFESFDGRPNRARFRREFAPHDEAPDDDGPDPGSARAAGPPAQSDDQSDDAEKTET